MAANDVLCVDVGDVTLWASLSACLTKGQRTLSSERLGTMGYGLCAGIVASLVRAGDGRAVVVVGDGGVQMTINELGTAQHLYANLDEDGCGNSLNNEEPDVASLHNSCLNSRDACTAL